jgi:hypothetical protein
MDTNKAGSLSEIGTSVLTVIIIALMLLPMKGILWMRGVSSVLLLLLIVAIPLAAFFRWKGAQLSRRREDVRQIPNPEVSVARLKILDFYVERAREDDRATYYRSKVRIVLKNETKDDLDIQSPSWTNSEVQVQLPEKLKLQLEEHIGGWELGKWQIGTDGKPRELYRIPLRPGEAFRTWIGLDQSVNDTKLRRKHEVRRVGILTFPISVAGKNSQVAVEL